MCISYWVYNFSRVQVVDIPLEKYVCLVETEDCPHNCTCIKRPSKLTFSVTCEAGTHDRLPKQLPDPDYPPPRIGKFQLNFSSSNIHTLEFRPYLTKTVWIDVSNLEIHSISNEVWKVLSGIQRVDFSRNRIKDNGPSDISWVWKHHVPLAGPPWKSSALQMQGQVDSWLAAVARQKIVCTLLPLSCGVWLTLLGREPKHLGDDGRWFLQRSKPRAYTVVEVFEPLRYFPCYFCSFVCCFMLHT